MEASNHESVTDDAETLAATGLDRRLHARAKADPRPAINCNSRLPLEDRKRRFRGFKPERILKIAATVGSVDIRRTPRARLFVAEQTPAIGASKLRIHLPELALTASLTPQQISILRRFRDGLGLPAYVFRPRHCAQDVELLVSLRLIASGERGLSIEPAGDDYLTKLDSAGSAGSREQLVGRGATQGRDPSIGVEHWPQEY